MEKTKKAMHDAKNALLYALRMAQEERAPAALRTQLDRLTTRAETLQWKIAGKAQATAKTAKVTKVAATKSTTRAMPSRPKSATPQACAAAL
jgi:hypothetical protein